MRRFGFVLSAVLMLCAMSQAAEWQWLFNGKNLDGWVQRNGKARYEVQDGMVVGTTVLNTPNSFLCTEKDYSDFILELEYLVEPTMNSGIQIRSLSTPDYKNGRVHGYQVEIDPSARAWSGGIYDEGRRGWLFPLKDMPEAQNAFRQNAWNHYRIEAIGDRIRTWVNGTPAADLQDDMTRKGFIALQVHSSKTAGQQIKWRNIRLQDLSGEPALKALIVDGQNNHDWKSCTPVLKAILEETGQCQVDVATTPAQGQDMSGFQPEWSKYDVIVSNYTGDEWPEATKKAFEEYMKAGGGLVVVHAADNAFPNWQAWNEMIALGGWGGRNEKSGPYIYWRDGQLVRDTSPGPGGAHGRQVEWVVVARNEEHPIMKGLPEKWLHVKDELYSRLRGPGKNMEVLATARQDTATGGTGRHEPVLFTIQYGKGRVFHTVLGHAAEQMKDIGFIVTLQRGTEWAATGHVMNTDVPADFPTETQTSSREPVTANLDVQAIREYDWGKSREKLGQIEATLRNAPKAMYPKFERQLVEALTAQDTTYAGRQFVFRMLRRVGSAQSVPAVAKYLSDDDLSHMARFALQHNSSEEAGAALRKAAGELQGDKRIGAIVSLGLRGDRQAVDVIAPLVKNGDAQTAQAAINALGRIGGEEAAKALADANVAAKLDDERKDALLRAADSLLKEGKSQQAAKVYRSMAEPENSTWIRIAAYRGLMLADGEKAAPQMIALLRDENVDLQKAAGKFIAEMPGEAATEAFAEQLSSLGPEAQVVLISSLESRGDKAAAPYVAELASESSNPQTAMSAVKALAELGGPEQVELLARGAGASGPTAKAAQESLARMSGAGVDAAVAELIAGDAAPVVRVGAIQAAVDRRQAGAADALLKAAQDENAQVRRAAYQGLGEVAGGDALAPLTRMLVAGGSSADRAGAERAMTAIVARNQDVDPQPVVAGLGRADAAEKEALLNVLAKIGGDAALKAVRGQVDSSDAAVKRAAIRALANWPEPTPLEDLLKIARSDSDATNRILALRGYVTLLSAPANRSAAETVELLAEAMQVAQRPQEKQMILSTLPKYPSQEALELAKQAQDNPQLASEAKQAVSTIEQALVNREMNVTASLGANDARNAIDKNAGTRWATGRPMKPGDWFVIDLGAERTVQGLTLDTANSANDYPRGYEVYVSFDGKSWGQPVLTGKGEEPVTEIEFPQPVRARFIRIVQTGSSDSWYWSIHELKVNTK